MSQRWLDDRHAGRPVLTAIRTRGAAVGAGRRFQAVRWSIFVVLMLAYVWVYFHRMAPAVASGELTVAFGTGAGALGLLAAIYFWIATVTQIPSGVIADTIGTRAVVTAGNLIAGAGSIVFGLAPTFAVATAGRLLVGLGVSAVFVCFMKSNTVWFSERRFGLISGLTLLIGNVGSILAAAPLAAVLSVASWRLVFVAIGVSSVALAGLSALVVRDRPEDVGLPSPSGSATPAGTGRPWQADLLDVLRNRDVWPSFLVNFGMLGSLYAFTGLWAVPLLRDARGLSGAAAADYTTVALIGFAIGALGLGWISDRLGVRKPVLVVSAAAYAATWLAVIALPWSAGPSGMALFALMGLAGGGFILTYPCAKEVAPPALSGMAISVVNTGVFLGVSLVQPLFGWMLDLGWRGQASGGLRVYSWAAYEPALLLMLGCALLAVLAGLAVRETHCRNVTAARMARPG